MKAFRYYFFSVYLMLNVSQSRHHWQVLLCLFFHFFFVSFRLRPALLSFYLLHSHATTFDIELRLGSTHCALKSFQVCYHIAKQAKMLHQSNVNAIKNVLDLTMTTPTTISTMTTTISTEEEKKIMTCHYIQLCETRKSLQTHF